MSIISFLYGFSLPIVSAFALTAWINWPIAIGGSIFALMFVSGKISKFKNFDFVLLLTFIFPIIISSFINISSAFEPKFASHLASYSTVFCMFYLAPRELLKRKATSLFFGITSGLIISLLYEYFEFVVANALDRHMLEIIPRVSVQEYDASFAVKITRARSFAEESGHYALYLGIICPIAIYLAPPGISTKYKWVMVLMTCVGLVLTFSTAGIAFSLAVIALLTTMSKALRVKHVWKVLIFGFLATATYAFFDLTLGIHLEDLVLIKVDDYSGRLPRFDESMSYFLQARAEQIFFGLGPGYYDRLELPSVISLCALTLFQTGVFGLICYLAMFIAAFKRINLFRDLDRILLRFAILFAFLMYLGSSNYWFPWIWLLFAIIAVGPMRRCSRHSNWPQSGFA